MSQRIGNAAIKLQPSAEPNTLPVGDPNIKEFWATREEMVTQALPEAVIVGDTALSAASAFGYLDRTNDKIRKILFGIGDASRGRLRAQEKSLQGNVYDAKMSPPNNDVPLMAVPFESIEPDTKKFTSANPDSFVEVEAPPERIRT